MRLGQRKLQQKIHPPDFIFVPVQRCLRHCTTLAVGMVAFTIMHCIVSIQRHSSGRNSTREISTNQPMPKSACGIAAYYNKALGITNLAVFAGYGRLNNGTKAKERFVPHDKFSDGRGWTNEFHLFNLKNGE